MEITSAKFLTLSAFSYTLKLDCDNENLAANHAASYTLWILQLFYIAR